MKKLYITFVTLLVIGITTGILYFTVIKEANMNLPEDVTLETAWGEPYPLADLKPKVRLVEFMYTNCPDICPVTTFKMKQLRQKLEKEGIFGDKVEFLSITIDPKRDSKEVLQGYANSFGIKPNSGWTVLRGSEEDIKKVADSFEFLFRDPGNGMYVHSSYTYFVDQKGNLVEVFGMGENGFDVDRVYKRIMNTID